MFFGMNNAQLVERIHQLKMELDGLVVLRDLSKQQLQYFEDLCAKMHVLNQSCQAVETVVGNWDGVFQSMALDNVEEDEEFVRIPVEEQ
jgi:hypothetical protein